MSSYAYFEENGTLVFKVPNAHPSLNAEQLEELVFKVIGMSNCSLSEADIAGAVDHAVGKAFAIYEMRVT